MNEVLTAAASKGVRTPARVWLLVALAVAVVLAANTHLVYVAAMSQPDCVEHVRPGEASVERGRFSAAQSSCSSAGETP